MYSPSFYFWAIIRKVRRFYNHHIIKDKKFTLIGNDCVSGLILKKYGLKYNTPTTFCRIKSDCFLTFVINLKTYVNTPLEVVNDSPNDVVCKLSPIGFPEITLLFPHYSSFNYTLEAWKRRVKRINYNNIYIIFDLTDDDNISNNDLLLFNELKYKKIILYKEKTRCDLSNINDKYKMIFGKEFEHIICNQIQNKWGDRLYTKYFELFDWARWLNNKRL